MTITRKQITILEYIRDTILVKINGKDPYYNTIISSNVYGDTIDYTELGDGKFPALFIVDAGDTALKMYNTSLGLTTADDDSSKVDSGWPITILGVLKESDIDYSKTGSMQSALIYLQGDIMLAMATDSSLGGNCNIAVPAAFVKRMPTEDHPFGTTGVLFSVSYDFNPFATKPVI